MFKFAVGALLSFATSAFAQVDKTPPVISAIGFVNSVWQAGSRQKIFVHMTDDVSGVSRRAPDFIDFDPLDGAKPRPSVVEPNSITKLRHERGDLYSFEFKVSRWLKPGSYALTSVNVYDRAGNSSQIYTNDDKYQTYVQGGAPTQIPVIQAQIQNSGVIDVTPPQLLDVYPDTPNWKSGSVHKIYFKLSDDVSGVPSGYIMYDAMVSLFEKNGRRLGAYPFKEIVNEGHGIYSAECTLSPYLPTGDYLFPYFIIEDRARNMLVMEKGKDDDVNYHIEAYTFPETPTKIPLLKVHIENTGKEDFTPPQILEWKIPNRTWKIGQKNRFYFRATDDVSGFAKGYGSLFMFSASITTGNESSIVKYFSFKKNEVRSEGHDWYSIEVTPGRYIQEGDYWIGAFDLSDSATNGIGVNCNRHGSCIYEGKEEKPAGLPQLKIRVVR